MRSRVGPVPGLRRSGPTSLPWKVVLAVVLVATLAGPIVPVAAAEPLDMRGTWSVVERVMGTPAGESRAREIVIRHRIALRITDQDARTGAFEGVTYDDDGNRALRLKGTVDGTRVKVTVSKGREVVSHWTLRARTSDGEVNLKGTWTQFIPVGYRNGKSIVEERKVNGTMVLTRVTFRMSGIVRGCRVDQPRCPEPRPLEDVTVKATGPAEKSAVTGPDGTWTLELGEGTYEVAPVGGRADPTSRTVDLSKDRKGIDFVLVRSHQVRGSVMACPPDSACPEPVPAEGVMVRGAGGDGAETTTGPDGRYALDVPDGTWVVAPVTDHGESIPVSRTLEVHEDIDGIDFRVCAEAEGTFVPCSSLEITVTPPAGSVFVEQTAEGPVVRDVPISVGIRNRGTRPMFDVTLDPQLVIGFAPGTVDALPAPQLAGGEPLPLRLKPAARPGDETRPVRIGTIQPGEQRMETLAYQARGDGVLDLTTLIGYTATPGGRTVSTTGDGRLTLDTRLVVASMRLDRPASTEVIKAGTAYSVRVKLENRSYTRKLLVWDVVRAIGNAEGGHWQPPGLPINVTAWSDLGMEACAAPPIVALDPLQTVEADVVFRALASDPRARTAVAGRNSGGVSARLELVRPRVFRDPTGTGEKATEVGPDRILLVPDASSLRLSIDDSATDVPEWRGAESWLAAWTYYSIGADAAVVSWTGSLLHGLFVDLPLLLVQGALELPGLARKMAQYQVEVWEQVRKDPALLALYSTGLGGVVAETYKLAPKLLTGGKQLADVANQAAYDHFEQMANDWYAGDWMSASQQFGSDVRTLELEIAALAAPCVLTRLPKVVEGARAARTAELVRSAEELGSAVDEATDASRAMDVLRSARSVGLPAVEVASHPIKLGTQLSDPLLRQLFGLTQEQVDWLREWARVAAKKGEPFLYTIRSRAAESLDWIGAFLKPEEIKIKTVNWIDSTFLGFKESDIGRLVVRKLPEPAELARRLEVEGIGEFLPNGKPNQLYRAILDRYQLRVDEWASDAPEYVQAMQRWDREGKVSFEYDWKENLVDPDAAPLKQPTTAGFRLRPAETTHGPVPENATKVVKDGQVSWEVEGAPIEGEVTEWVVEVDPEGIGAWRSVTGDVDGVALTDVFGQNLDDARHIELASMLAAGPMGSPHLETLSWWKQAGEFLWDGKLKYLKGVHAQLGPDGVFRLVEMDLSPQALEFLKSPDDYMAFFIGGYVVP